MNWTKPLRLFINVTLLVILIGVTPLFSLGQSIQKHLDKGGSITLKVDPIAHRIAGPITFHTYQIIKIDSLYQITLVMDNETFRNTFSKKELTPFITYIRKRRRSKKYVGLSKDNVILMIGESSQQFTASFTSDRELYNIMNKYKLSNLIKMGVH